MTMSWSQCAVFWLSALSVVDHAAGVCSSRCTSCHGSTCNRCIDGYYPWYANCEPCSYLGCQTCSRRGMCDTCTAGYYLDDNRCNRCSVGCQTCSSASSCDTCDTGLWGRTCNTACGVGCEGDACGKDDGHCSCRPGYQGSQCDKKCTPGECPKTCASQCELCDNTTGKCTKCKHSNTYGAKCQYKCSTGCVNQTCNVTSGQCHACNDGYFGTFCDTPCSNTCINNQCNRNGNCTSGCTDSHYGPQCQFKCSDNCTTAPHGSNCDDQGHCLHGCVNGFTGDDCNTAVNPPDVDADQQMGGDKAGIPVPVIAGGVGGLVLLIVVIVVVVLLLRRRNHQQNDQQTDPQPPHIYQGLNANRQHHTYSVINQERGTTPGECSRRQPDPPPDPQPPHIYQGLNANRQHHTYSVINQERVASAVVYDDPDPTEAQVTVTKDGGGVYFNTGGSMIEDRNMYSNTVE